MTPPVTITSALSAGGWALKIGVDFCIGGRTNKIFIAGLRCSATATAYAQTRRAAGAAATDANTGELQKIVVTGRLSAVRQLRSPMVSHDTAAIASTGAANTANLLAIVPAITSFNTLPIGGNQEYRCTGATVPGMRGLPGTAVLVLLNGHRLVGDSPLLSTAGPSSIPAGAIERVEIVQDGGSATYGSDAWAARATGGSGGSWRQNAGATTRKRIEPALRGKHAIGCEAGYV